MFRMLRITGAAAIVLMLAACAPAAAKPNWTFAPAGAPNAEPVTPAPPEATEPAPTPASTPAPAATPAAPGTSDAPRVVEVTMGNFFFEPDSLSVEQGETVRFVVNNPTTIPHELVIGDAEEQEHHAMEMAEGMEHGDEDMMSGDHMMSEPNEVEVEPGETADMIWTFDEAGEILLGCHVPGHWEAGMAATVTVGG